MREPLPPQNDPGLVYRRVRVAREHVVTVRGNLEASEGLASMFAERGGDLLLVTSTSRAQELDEFISDLRAEVGALTDISDFSSIDEAGSCP